MPLHSTMAFYDFTEDSGSRMVSLMIRKALSPDLAAEYHSSGHQGHFEFTK